MIDALVTGAIVIDASALLAILVELPADDRLRERIGGAELHAPHLLDLEVLSALRRLEQRGELGQDETATARGWFADLLVERHPHHHLANRIWELRASVTPYDGAYVSLSEALGVPLVTSDLRLSRATGHHAVIESFAR